jgi:hypothetical protein
MQRLEVRGAVQPLYGSLGVKGLSLNLRKDISDTFRAYVCEYPFNMFMYVQTSKILSYFPSSLRAPCCDSVSRLKQWIR